MSSTTRAVTRRHSSRKVGQRPPILATELSLIKSVPTLPTRHRGNTAAERAFFFKNIERLLVVFEMRSEQIAFADAELKVLAGESLHAADDRE